MVTEEGPYVMKTNTSAVINNYKGEKISKSFFGTCETMKLCRQQSCPPKEAFLY